jgi:gluconolactonase
MTLDREKRLIVCEHGNRRITRTDTSGSITVLADRYDGKRFNSPNDIVVKSDGSIYFTDPPYGLHNREDHPDKELPFSGVYRVQNGSVELLTSELPRPNGLAFSPDQRFLYVGNSQRERMIWMRYPVRPDGSLAAGAVLYDAAAHSEPGVPDGFRIGPDGTLFCTGPGGILVISPEGNYFGTVAVPEVTANCVFGDPDGKALYVCATTSIYRIRGLL